jgi:hypothetical protein
VLDDAVRHRCLDRPLDVSVAELCLRLALELRVRQLDADDRRQPLANVVAAQVGILLGEDPGLASPVVERRGERGSEAGDVRAAVDGMDVVGKGQNRLGEAVVVLQGDLHARGVDHPLDVDRPLVQHLAPSVQVADEARHPTLEVEVLLAVDSIIAQADPEPLVQVGGFSQPRRNQVPAEIQRLEDLRVWLEEGARTVLPLLGGDQAPIRLRRAALLADRALGIPAAVLLRVALAVSQNLNPHCHRERVHDAHPDAVEPAGNLVATAAKLPARMEDGMDHLERVLARRVATDRDPATIVNHLHLPVAVDRHVDASGDVGHGLVDAVVDHLPHQLVEAARIGGADVHAGALTDGGQTLEHLDVRRGVVRGRLAAPGTGLRLRRHVAPPPPTPRVMIA